MQTPTDPVRIIQNLSPQESMIVRGKNIPIENTLDSGPKYSCSICLHISLITLLFYYSSTICLKKTISFVISSSRITSFCFLKSGGFFRIKRRCLNFIDYIIHLSQMRDRLPLYFIYTILNLLVTSYFDFLNELRNIADTNLENFNALVYYIQSLGSLKINHI